MSGVVRRAWAALGAIVLLGCVNHPVGPARSFDAYEAKASTTAESALSAVETVRLLARTAADGDAFANYTAVAVSEQEDTLGGLRGTFESIQPPDARSEELRARLSELLTRAVDDTAAVRIEVRRGHLDALSEVAAPLAPVAVELAALIEELA
jgi:hypothetical protein